MVAAGPPPAPSGPGVPGPLRDGLTALDLTGVVAGLAVLVLAGSHATIRRATV